IVAGQTGMFLIFTVSFGVIGLITEREEGTMTRLRSMPMPAGLIVAAKAGGGFILGLIATTVLLTIGTLLFDVSFGSVPLVALVVVAGVLAATSLVFLIARVARTAEQAGVAQAITAIVLGIAGGAFFPLAASGWVATVLDLNPIAAFIRGLGITAGGGGLGQLGTPLATMLIFAIVMIVLSRLVPDREEA
ncbi:MAG TPA: ABC transporter permease, partial [Actinomycetaceae bacterium]|nr:ABC transporter permease [Actinomycetaceae bacterium]